nr:hypothetical protein [Tanacetum cinerariifolium]
GGDSEDDDNDRNSNGERTECHNDKRIDLNKINDKEEEDQGDKFLPTPNDYVPADDETQDVDEEEYVRINEKLYDDVNVEMKHVEPLDKEKGDEQMTDAKKVDVERKEINQEVTSAKVQDEVQTTTTIAPVTQKEKTEAPPLSSSRSVSSNYGSIFLNLDNIYSSKSEIMFMLDVQVQQEVPKIQSSLLLTVPILVIPKPIVLSLILEFIIKAPATTISSFIPHT